MSDPSAWWHPDIFAVRSHLLRARSRIKDAVRRYFLDRQFVEVETPILQVSPGNETHISAFATDLDIEAERTVRMYLHTSPELTCKKLLAAGVSDLFTIASVFRNRERGRLHHPEFQMLEWYRGGASLDDLISDCVAILALAAQAAETRVFRHRDAEADVSGAPEIVTVSEAFRRNAGIDLDSMLPPGGEGFAAFEEAVRGLGLRVAADDTWSDLFSKVLSAKVEPALGVGRPTFLTRYPASEAALARLCPDDPRFAERFELYVCGVELANAFGELRDADEQRRRFEAAEKERLRIYGRTYPIDDDFLNALGFMPEASGIALGFDRLVMLATGAATVADVMWAPVQGRA